MGALKPHSNSCCNNGPSNLIPPDGWPWGPSNLIAAPDGPWPPSNLSPPTGWPRDSQIGKSTHQADHEVPQTSDHPQVDPDVLQIWVSHRLAPWPFKSQNHTADPSNLRPEGTFKSEATSSCLTNRTLKSQRCHRLVWRTFKSQRTPTS